MGLTSRSVSPLSANSGGAPASIVGTCDGRSDDHAMDTEVPLPSPTTTSTSQKESRQIYVLLFASIVSVLFLLSLSFSLSPFTRSSTLRYSSFSLVPSSPSPPSLSYLLSGSAPGDGDRILRLLHSVYHPRNLYLLALSLPAPEDERRRLAIAVRSVPTFAAVGNVHVIGRPGFSNPRGASALAATLHGASILLRLGRTWDWFINLRASDYPLVSQDDLLHVFSFLPRDLNFVQHSSNLSASNSHHRIRPIVIDPGLYLNSNLDVFFATQKRDVPNAFKLFTGSPSVILSRKFVEFCITGTNNFPRTLLLYHTNTLSPHTDYFQTLICNTPEFNGTVVNSDLRFIIEEARTNDTLASDEFKNMAESGAAFGKLPSVLDDSFLKRIDDEILNSGPNGTMWGGWCLDREKSDSCKILGHTDVLVPGPASLKLASAISSLLSNVGFYSQQCL